jgi:dihydrofolate reductase
MRLVLSEFISLDGVIQAPGQRQEDTDGGFQHGGWSMRYFDADSMGSAIEEAMQETDAYIFGRRTWQVSAAAWPPSAEDLDYLCGSELKVRSYVGDLDLNVLALVAGVVLPAAPCRAAEEPGDDIRTSQRSER